jgi:hypothetical protein
LFFFNFHGEIKQGKKEAGNFQGKHLRGENSDDSPANSLINIMIKVKNCRFEKENLI